MQVLKQSRLATCAGMLFAAVFFGSTSALAGEASPPPDLEVTIAGSLVTSGSTRIIEDVAPGETAELFAILRNVGTGPAFFQSNAPVTLTSATPTVFSVVQPALQEDKNTPVPADKGVLFRLDPGGATAFRIDFTPDAFDTVYAATVTIASDDPDSPFTLNIAASSAGQTDALEVFFEGQLIATLETLTFDDQPPAQPRLLTFILFNPNAAAITFDTPAAVELVSPDAGVFSLTPPLLATPGVLIAGGTAVFGVQFTPPDPGMVYTATLGIASNAANSPAVFKIQVTSSDGEGEFCVEQSVHSADQNANNEISLSELLRVIQFFNSGGYNFCPELMTEDSFCPGAP